MVNRKPKERLALLWSFDPYGDYGDDTQMVGSVLAHMGHLERHGGVYWCLYFRVSTKTISDFDFPMSAYLYSSSSQLVEYRASIIDVCIGAPKRNKEALPTWRMGYESEDFLHILLDQIDSLFPERELEEFSFFDDRRPVKSAPVRNYLKVIDSMY